MHAVQPLAYDDATRETDDDAFLAALEPVLAKFRHTPEREQSLVLLRAVRLSPTLELCERYLRGERLPISVLDQEWAKAYGLIP
jgi:hypothetical protein